MNLPFPSKRAPAFADVPDEKWNDWRWQLSHRLNSAEEIEKVRQGGITDEELTLAKNELRVSRQVARQTNDFYSLTAALDELYGLGFDNMDRYDARIEKVTKEDVKAVAQKYLNPEACAGITVSSPS